MAGGGVVEPGTDEGTFRGVRLAVDDDAGADEGAFRGTRVSIDDGALPMIEPVSNLQQIAYRQQFPESEPHVRSMRYLGL